MKRPLQVSLDESELRRLDDWARNRGWTKSEAVRAAVGALLRDAKSDDVLALSGMVQGLPPDLSERFDAALEETFVAERAPAYGRRRRAVLDSSGWLALVSASDGRHRDAHDAFARAVTARRPLVTTTLVLAEVHRVLLHRAGVRPARTFLARIERSALVSLAPSTATSGRPGGVWCRRGADQARTPASGAAPSAIPMPDGDAPRSRSRRRHVA